jgi:Xaa-Pro aminopeptidase
MFKDREGKINERVYIERSDEVSAKWVGEALDAKGAKEASGIEKTAFIDEFEKTAASVLFVYSPEVFMDLECRSFNTPRSRDVLFAEKIRSHFPALALRDAYPLFAKLRSIKTADEVAKIREAVAVTKEGIYAIMKAAKPGMKESELEARFNYELNTRGVVPSFNSIVAGGKNAAVLHYEKNDDTVDGGLVLVDLGAQSGFHCADISRTFPIGGKFSERERQFYEIVLEANKRVLDMIKPGLPFKELNEAVVDFYAEALKEIGLIKDKDGVGEFYYHGVSHPLGLEVHDIGRNTFDALEAGMVLTVEPGLYIAAEGIGIRIEDNVLVTADGCENLSEDIIKMAAEIEEFMS